MELVVNVLRGANMLISTPNIVLSRDEFERAVAAAAADPAKATIRKFMSTTGRTEWSFLWEKERLIIEAQLLSRPAMEGVGYGEHRRKVRRNIDAAVGERKVKWQNMGFAESLHRLSSKDGNGKRWTIGIGTVTLRYDAADEIGGSIAHVTRIIES